MNHAHIPGFPNRIPNIDWQAYLPRVKDQKGDDDALHLFRFHKRTHKLGVELHEDSLMKMLMVILEGMHGHGMSDYHQKFYLPLPIFIQYFMNILKINILPCC